jgi:hypothetical protein
MPLVINLSSVHELMSIPPNPMKPWEPCVLYEFVKLCPSNRWYLLGADNLAWVANEYSKNDSKLIAPYKLGKITTENFLTGLLDIFPFLKEEVSTDTPEARAAKLALAKIKLANAWNSIIQWDDKKSTMRLEHVLTMAANEDVYFISNTNPLNIEKILTLFREKFPHIQWQPELSALENEPIQIAPHIYLCLSYRYGLFKEGTPGLLEAVTQQIKARTPNQEIRVISQYSGDLLEANRLNLAHQKADDFYPKLELESKCAIM